MNYVSNLPEDSIGKDITWLFDAVQLFGGLVYAGNPILETTTMFENEYPSSLSSVLIFLSLLNQWKLYTF